jgi:manganese/iron transport system permease protein
VMGVVFSAMFALGIVLITAFPSDVHLDHILFGNMLGVECALPDNAAALLWGADANLLSGAATLWRGCGDIFTSAAIAIPVTLILILKWRDLMLHAFDPAQAQVSGLPVRLLHYGLLAILALTIVATLSSVGLILAIGLLIAPGAIAFLLTRSFGAMLVTATLVCVLAMIGGIWASFHLDAAPAPTIILILTALFALAFLRRVLQVRTG